jgi:hypothetical protein
MNRAAPVGDLFSLGYLSCVNVCLRESERERERVGVYVCVRSICNVECASNSGLPTGSASVVVDLSLCCFVELKKQQFPSVSHTR